MRKEEKELREEFGDDMYERMKEHLYSKKAITGKGSPFSEILQKMVNTMLSGELEAHIDEEKASGRSNKRNGKISKKVMSDYGALHIETPRDRNSSFEPEVVAKRQRQINSGLDDQILALYAQGNSVEDVRRLLMKIYGVEISAGKISQITDKVLPEIESWRTRELKKFYPVIYLDAIHFKVRRDGKYKSSAFFTVYAVDWDGHRDLLGLYMHGAEGAARWALILEDLKKRGVEDVLVICTDDLKGFSEVIEEIFPQTIVQKCIVHQVRNSLRIVDEKEKKKVGRDLRYIYTASSVEEAQIALETFEVKWGEKYNYIVKQWRSKWEELTAFMSYPVHMRKMIYTTNPVEAVHRVIRKLVKSKAAWVSETALLKQLYLSLMQNTKSWKRRAYGWTAIRRDLLTMYPDRVPQDE